MTFLFQLELAGDSAGLDRLLQRLASEYIPGGLAQTLSYPDLQWLVAYGWADAESLTNLLTQLLHQSGKLAVAPSMAAHPFAGLLHRFTLLATDSAQVPDLIKQLRWISRRVGDASHVPIILVDKAGRSVIRRSAAIVLADGYAAMEERLKSIPPEFGPAHVHPLLGVTLGSVATPRWEAVVDLDDQNLSVAQRVARKLRGRDGGLSGLEAIAREGAAHDQSRLLLWADQPTDQIERDVEKRLQALAESENINPGKIKTIGLGATELLSLKPAVTVS